MSQKLGIVEFEEVLLSNISDLIVNDFFINNNEKYWSSIVSDLFSFYYYSVDEVLIKNLSKTIEVTISNNIIYKMKF